MEVVVDIARDTLYTIIKVAAPPVIVSLIVGLIVSIFQTVTSIQEQTLTFVPKIIAVFLTIIFCGSWMIDTITNFAINLWSNFEYYLELLR